MKNPQRVSDGVYVFQSDLWMINSTLILNDLGSFMIDPAFFPEEIHDIAGFVKSKSCKVGYVIFTHSDFDHIVGYQNFEGARTIGSRFFDECDCDEQMLQLYETDSDFDVTRDEFLFPLIDIEVKNYSQMLLKQGKLTFFEGSGHTRDSLFIVFEEKGILFAGDTLSDIEFPFICFDSTEFRSSLDQAKKLVDKYDIKILVPGHGNVTKDRKEILQRIENDIEYINSVKFNTSDLFKQGLTEREILSVMMDFDYCQEPIEGSILKMHVDNVRQILQELKSK